MFVSHVGDHSITKSLENIHAALKARGADPPANVHRRANRLEELSFSELPLVINWHNCQHFHSPTDFHRMPTHSSAASSWVGVPFPTNHTNIRMLPCLCICANSSISSYHLHTTAGKYSPFSSALLLFHKINHYCLQKKSASSIPAAHHPTMVGAWLNWNNFDFHNHVSHRHW